MVCEDDYHAPNGCIQIADQASCPTCGRRCAESGRDRDASIVGGKIYVKRLHDVKSETSVYALDGKPAGTIEYDGIGSASAWRGAPRTATATSRSRPS